MTAPWDWEPEQLACVTEEWARGITQQAIADRYRMSISYVNEAIELFIRKTFPELVPPYNSKIGVYGAERKELARRAVLLWKGRLEPPSPTKVYKKYRVVAKPRLRHRPIDMGGPRDVWLEFYPPPDPRFDNMAPVT